jgi:hypothetical protein
MNVAYLINTTPKYFYLLEFHIGLIRRYAPTLGWDIWIATEEPTHPLCTSLVGVHILKLEKDEGGFLKSREAALRRLPSNYKYIIPMQEDFILERAVDMGAIEMSIHILNTDDTVDSIRWMPCPGPSILDNDYNNELKELNPKNNKYMFTFQACIWRIDAIKEWYSRLCTQFEIDYPDPMTDEERRNAEIRANYAENPRGQRYFSEWMTKKHLAWKRAHKYPNAVYLSPWPYRPTAVVGGKLEGWAIELAKREGFVLM